MDTSKIVVFALEFQAALKAALAVAPKTDPNDLIQFRIVRDELVISARTQWELISIEVSTQYVDMNYERDSVFEITRNEAVALSSMRMKKEEEDDDPMVGLIVQEKSIIRTDESGFGLGLRSVKVKRHGNHYEAALGNVPRVLIEARRETPSTRKPTMEPKQLAMVSSAFRAWNKVPIFWTPSSDAATVVKNVVMGSGITMVVMSSQFEHKEKAAQLMDGDASADELVEEIPLDIEVVPNFSDTDVVDKRVKHAKDLAQQYEAAFKKKITTANPPGGLA